MSTGQVFFLVLGGLIFLSSFDFSSLLKKVENKVENINISNPPKIQNTDSLVDIVQKWQILKNTCEKNNLTEAVSKLNEIFPMLIKADK